MRALSSTSRLLRAFHSAFTELRTDSLNASPRFPSRSIATASSAFPPTLLLSSPWSATQLRGAKFRGADVKPGNVIERRGKIYQVVKAQHTTQGRGGAIIQVELRNIENGSKLNERLRTDESVEKIFVQEETYLYLYTDDEAGVVVLMEPDTNVMLEVPKHLFGESLPYLQVDMKVSVQLYDERPMSASVPQKVICTVSEAQDPIKGASVTPQYKKVVLDNGLTIQVPSYIVRGDKVVVNTTDHSYVSRDSRAESDN